ncbi:MAG: AAA family ATPase [Bacteroidales bacterium]|nr:AAA family ATPase [Bacteroidales bacterium]
MILKRKIDSKLVDWKAKNPRKALLIRGARQVGKTTSVRNFGQAHYSNIVEVNFEKMPRAKEAFAGNLDADTIVLSPSNTERSSEIRYLPLYMAMFL